MTINRPGCEQAWKMSFDISIRMDINCDLFYFLLELHFPCLNANTYYMKLQVVFGASKQGVICAWDLRGGRTSLAFQSLNEVQGRHILYMFIF